MSLTSFFIGSCTILGGILYAVVLINSGDWNIALIVGVPPIVIGTWIVVRDKLGKPESEEKKTPQDQRKAVIKVKLHANLPEK